MKSDAEIAAMIAAAVRDPRFYVGALMAVVGLFSLLLLGEGLNL